MTRYRRPEVHAREFLDADGHVIDYGSRWGADGPPTSAYSVDTHPERFAPVHLVAEALISELVRSYDVVVVDGLEIAEDLMREYTDVVRAVRLTPASADAAPLTFVFTSYPGVFVHAGLLHDFFYPVCGCDACDETWESQADDLEWQIFAIVGGGYRETWLSGFWPRVGYSLEAVDASQSEAGESRAKDLPAHRVTEAKKQLKAVRSGWQRWPVRG